MRNLCEFCLLQMQGDLHTLHASLLDLSGLEIREIAQALSEWVVIIPIKPYSAELVLYHEGYLFHDLGIRWHEVRLVTVLQ